MRESMMERVARALLAGHDWTEAERWDSEPNAPEAWDRLPADWQNAYRNMARSAIAAMRECNGQMVEAGAEELAPYALDEGKWSAACEQVLDIWPAMIDVALCLPRDGR